MARQTAPLPGSCAPSPTLLPEPPGKQGAILPRLLQPLPGGWNDWQSVEQEEESPKLLLC